MHDNDSYRPHKVNRTYDLKSIVATLEIGSRDD